MPDPTAPVPDGGPGPGRRAAVGGPSAPPDVPDPPHGRPAGPPAHRSGPRPAASRARRLAAPVATLAGIAAAWTYVGQVDPNEPGHYPVCPLYALTGLYCPGCGGLRSAHAVAHGDLVTALGDNALAVVGYAVFALFWVLWLVRAWRRLPVRVPQKPVWWWTLGGVILLFTVVRNLPFGSSLAP